MRVVWSLMLAGGLLLIGLQVGESRGERDRDRAARPGAETGGMTALDDGTGFPPPDPPKPPR